MRCFMMGGTISASGGGEDGGGDVGVLALA